MSKLICNNVGKIYSGKHVLEHIDLELESGKIYGLLGRNGAGKTTLLSILTGQNPQSEGIITFDGKPVWENQEVLDQLCFSRELNPLTGMGANVMKVKEYLKMAEIYLPNWDKEMADKLVLMFKLEKKKRISKLSKGMLSMVTIVVAMASKAPFTFLDEPVSGLDVVAREEFYRMLVDEYERTGRTFVISTHIIEEAANVMEEVVILHKGKLLLKENTQELLERCVYVYGREDVVDKAVYGMDVRHAENMGRGKGVTVLLKPGQEIDPAYDVSVQPMSLQKVFVGLCGEEGRL